MSLTFKPWVLTILFILATSTSWSKPLLDGEVQQFLNSNSVRSEQVLPVIITYKNLNSRSQLPSQFRSRSEFQRSLISTTLKTQNQIFNDMLRGQTKRFKTLWALNGTIAYLTREQLKEVLKHKMISSVTYGHKKVRLMEPALGSPLNTNSKFTYGLTKIKIPETRALYSNLDGTGVRVGILDTGIDATHPEFKGKILNYKNFSPSSNQRPEDLHGHGTHVAGTIAGGALSGQSIGVAPNVSLIVGRIFDGNADSTKEKILLSMQWMADPDGNPETNDFAQIVNSSWGDDEAYSNRDPQDDPFCRVVDTWVSLGIIPVFSVGNSGPRPGTVGVPGACPQALSVGATEINDRSPHFSSSGPTTWKTVRLIKPEVVAPGVNIISTMPRGRYDSMTGTSMSTPHISGVLALMLQANPKLSVDQATEALIKGSKDLGTPGKDNTFGWGRADILKSIELIK